MTKFNIYNWSRYLLLLLCISLTIIQSCGLKKDFILKQKREPLRNDEKVIERNFITLKLNDSTEEIGTVEIRARGIFINNCSYNGLLEEAEIIARENGANIIAISKYKCYIFPVKPFSYLRATLYYSKNINNYKQSINWNLYQKLTWDDFLGEVPDSSIDKQLIAYSNIFFHFKIYGSKTDAIFFTSLFDRGKSWVKDSLKNDLLLLHEQVHFDISELYSRKLNDAFRNKKIRKKAVYTKGKPLYNMITSEYDEFLKKYDEETENGTNKKKQYEWYIEIVKELSGTPVYDDKNIKY